MKDITAIKTFAELKKLGYQSKSIKNELRDNLIERLKRKEKSCHEGSTARYEQGGCVNSRDEAQKRKGNQRDS